MKPNPLSQSRKSLGLAVAVTLIGSACPVMAQVTLLQSDPSGTFSFNTGANWSDGFAPSAGKTYSVTGTSDTTFTLRAPLDATFAGDSLSINNRGLLAWAPPGSTGTPTGTLTINNLILNGGAISNFRTGGTLILAGNISVQAQTTLNIGSTANATARNMTLNAPITGSSRLRVSAAGTGSNVLTVNGNNSNFSGGFELLNGDAAKNTITVGHANALGSGATTVTQGILNLNGYSVSIGGLAGANASNSFVQNNSSTPATLTVNSSADTSYAGVIRNGTGDVALTKSGAATLTLGGANTYTGATTVEGGTLNITGSTAAASTVSVGGVDASGTPRLAGSGTVNGAVTLKSAGGGAVGVLNAGDATLPNTVGTLALGDNLTFESGSIFEWDVTNATGYDRLTGQAGKSLSGTGAVFTIITGTDYADVFWNTNRIWTDIFSGFGTIDDWDNMFTSIAGDQITWTDNKGVVGNINPGGDGGYFTLNATSLTWTAIPEPSTALGGLLLTAGLLRRRRQGKV